MQELGGRQWRQSPSSGQSQRIRKERPPHERASQDCPCRGSFRRNASRPIRLGRAVGGTQRLRLRRHGETAVARGMPADRRRYIRTKAISAATSTWRGTASAKANTAISSIPLPDLIGGLRTALYPHLADVANDWNERMGIEQRYPDAACRIPKAMPRPRPDAADAAAAAICSGRLQLPASGSLRRSRIPAAGGDPAVRTGRGFHRRRVRADRAAAAHAEPRRGGAAATGRCGGLRRPQPAGEGHARATIASISGMASAASAPAMRHTVGIIFHDAK